MNKKINIFLRFWNWLKKLFGGKEKKKVFNNVSKNNKIGGNNSLNQFNNSGKIHLLFIKAVITYRGKRNRKEKQGGFWLFSQRFLPRKKMRHFKKLLKIMIIWAKMF